MKKLTLFIMVLLFAIGGALAQTRVTGFVYDEENGEPIIGATVKVDGTKIVVVTDIDGKFVLTGLDKSARKATISYVGYETQTADIKPDMKVFLASKAELLDEVIVVAFGKQKRESFTGSASVINAEQIQRMQVTNPLDALNGRVTGMQMTENNSIAGDPVITIRGKGSLSAGTAPLIVLDGVPYNGYYTDINPADIANITVLKDAASNALYGARGANGVILITTTQAQRGATKVRLDAKWGSNHDALVNYDYIDNPGEYYEAHYLALRNYAQYRQG